jgi:hypothetical protein
VAAPGFLQRLALSQLRLLDFQSRQLGSDQVDHRLNRQVRWSMLFIRMPVKRRVHAVLGHQRLVSQDRLQLPDLGHGEDIVLQLCKRARKQQPAG